MYWASDLAYDTELELAADWGNKFKVNSDAYFSSL